MNIEKMNEFFEKRIENYDEHMIQNVEGCKNAYIKLAEVVPSDTKKLLDLGCGTGLELEEIFKLYPNIAVTGIDITEAMLKKLKAKYTEKNITLINDSYLNYDFGFEIFDTAISFQTMHHMSHDDKLSIYKNVHKALKSNGSYIECDYMIEEQYEEDMLYAENAKIRKKQNIKDSEFYHFDTPCTMENQIKLLLKAGFSKVKHVFREGNTTIMVAKKIIPKEKVNCYEIYV